MLKNGIYHNFKSIKISGFEYNVMCFDEWMSQKIGCFKIVGIVFQTLPHLLDLFKPESNLLFLLYKEKYVFCRVIFCII
jgi:hypothetical protein